MDYDVQMISVDAGPMWTGIAQGDSTRSSPLGFPAPTRPITAGVGRSGKSGSKHPRCQDRSRSPSYVTIDSIEELNSHRAQFQGRIVGIDPGAGFMQATDEAIEAYDLNFTLQDGSDAAMTAELGEPSAPDQWIVVTGWTPHWKFAQWDLKYLEDPRRLRSGRDDQHHRRRDLKDRMPEVYHFLDRFYWTPDDMASVMVDIREGMSEAEAARKWIAENPEKVEAWLP